MRIWCNTAYLIWYVNMLLRFFKRLLWWRSIAKKTCKKLSCYIEKTESLSYREQIIQYDKIYHHTLKELWYSGSFGEILKRNPREIKNIQDIWDLHKLRNSLVHDLKNWDENILRKQAESYKKVSNNFVKQVTQ